MSREEIYDRLKEIFEDVLDLEDVELKDETTAEDIEEWDSLAHITLIAEIEDEFEIKFPMKYVLSMKNVGEMVSIIEELL
mgnify:CR=1 FL=1